jgi:peptidoglycan hydrolase CwlO-like protein
MSSTYTVPAMCSPCPVISSPPPLSGSFVSLFKKEEDSKGDDSMLSIIEDMKTIRNNIDVDTKKVNSIKEQIKKLQEDLNTTEEKIKKDKSKLKELAVKIADC